MVDYYVVFIIDENNIIFDTEVIEVSPGSKIETCEMFKSLQKVFPNKSK